MLKDDFYTIHSITRTDKTIDAEVTLPPSHPIYAGHFPGQPVVPGACMLQMLKEIISFALANKVQLVKAADIKFMRMINPLEDGMLHVNIQYSIAAELVNVTAAIFKNNETCLKARLQYKQ